MTCSAFHYILGKPSLNASKSGRNALKTGCEQLCSFGTRLHCGIVSGQTPENDPRSPAEGYYRSDGTYVRGHYRSAPDGDPSNNYSRRGNSPRFPLESDSGLSSTYASSAYEEADRRLRQRAAVKLQQLGYDVDWQSYSHYQLADTESRIRQAQRLRALGITVDWQQHTYYEMSDSETRIRQADRLPELGLRVNWQDYTYSQMSDWEARIRQAKRLAELGLSVNWREHTYYEMSDWESRIRLAKELERLGASVDWRQFHIFPIV